MLHSYLSNRYFQVRVREALSEEHPATAGVPQGSVLGPTLYTLFTADLPLPSEDTTGPDKALVASYADDVAVLINSTCERDAAECMQDYISTLDSWTKQ